MKRIRQIGMGRRPSYRYPLAALVVLCSLLASHLLQAGGNRPPSSYEGVFVRRAVDGDTVVLSSGERLRYIGMDTPELHHPKKPVQWYAREAMEFNRTVVEGKPVRLEFDVERYDKYRRLLAYVYLQDGTFVNAELVRQGYAKILTIPPNVKYADLFLKYQREAREASRGLWGKR